jgi:hypothetical protein
LLSADPVVRQVDLRRLGAWPGDHGGGGGAVPHRPGAGGGRVAGGRPAPGVCPAVVGAENLCHLGVCTEEAVRVNARAWRLLAGLHAGGRAMIFGLWA